MHYTITATWELEGDGMEEILHYIEAHIDEPLTNKQLADIAGYSESHFIRLFKQYTGMTCMHYIWKQRLIRASEAIISGVRIIDAAFQYGWQSHSAFTKSFKREFGFSPSLLRTMYIELNCLGGNHMNCNFMRKPDVGATKEQLFELLKISLKDNGIKIGDTQLNRVYRFACQTYAGITRYSGEEYVTHPLNVSIILSEMGAEPNVILAGMLCDSTAKGNLNTDKCSKELPSEIFHIVAALKIENKNLKTAPEEVIQIKLAERLHNMRTIDYVSDTKKELKIKETIEIFMPLARRLNCKKLIDELNELAAK